MTATMQAREVGTTSRRAPKMEPHLTPTAPISSEVVRVTPEMAAEWLERNNFAHQRKLRQDRVDELAAAIRAGEFELTAIKFHRWAGHEQLTDGQHRLWAIVESGISTDLVVIRQLAESAQAVGEAYGRIDTGAVRTPAEAMSALMMAETTGLTQTQLNKMWSAVKVLMNGFMGQTATGNRWEYRVRSRVMRGIVQWKGEARLYFDAIQPGSETHRARLSSAAVLAVGLVTLRYQPERALEFWSQVGARADLQVDTGPWKLVEFVTENPLRIVNDASRRVAGCWNAFYHNRPLSRLQVKSVTIPINIDGTPYNTTRIIREVFDGD